MAKKIRKTTSEKVTVRESRRLRVRKKVVGTPERPRLCVTKTNRTLSVQIIDDDRGMTLLSAVSAKGKTVNIGLATDLGKEVAQKALAAGIKACVFDRSGNLYHGRVAAVATGAREGGLQF